MCIYNVYMNTIYRRPLGISVPTLHTEEDEGQWERQAAVASSILWKRKRKDLSYGRLKK